MNPKPDFGVRRTRDSLLEFGPLITERRTLVAEDEMLKTSNSALRGSSKKYKLIQQTYDQEVELYNIG